MGETPDSGNILLRMRSRVDFPELRPLQERPERQEKRSGYSIAAERWGRAKWLIALLVVIAVVLIVMALGRGM
jgi:hypothetical protein